MTPSLSLDFTTGSLDSRITFTRSGNTATVVNSSGYVVGINADLPRFDYDPVTLAIRGLLIEEPRTNSITNSSTLTTWTRSNVNVTTPGTVTAPDGTTNSVLLSDGTTASVAHCISLAWSPVANTTYTLSFYAKYQSRQYVFMSVRGAASNYAGATFDVQNGATFSTAALGTGFSVTSSSVVNVGNGWYRFTATVVVGTTVSSPLIFLGLSDGSAFTTSGFPAYTGTSQTGYFYAPQIEAGAFATSYIPTTTTALTRNADVATITGTNFSSFWQASKGGVLVRARPGTVSGTRPWVQFDDGTANEIIALRGNTTNPELYIVDGGTPQAQIDAGTIAANTDYNMTAWWQTNDCKARLDSGAVVADTSATIPTVTQARLGSDGTNYLNGHLASISYYDTFSGQIYTRRKNKAVFNLM